MKRILITVATAIMIVVSISQCTVHRSSVYEAKMDDLRSQVQVGDNIYEAAKKIEGRYHHTTGPLDPTKRGKELWLHVNFGLQPTLAETMAYTAEIDLPFDDNKPITAIIKADAAGTITNIQ